MLTRVPHTTNAEFEQAVDSAAEAYKSWSRTSVLARQRFAMECVYMTTSTRFRILTPG